MQNFLCSFLDLLNYSFITPFRSFFNSLFSSIHPNPICSNFLSIRHWEEFGYIFLQLKRDTASCNIPLNPFCLNFVLLILTATDKEALAEYQRASPAALISCCFLFLHSLVFSADEKILHSQGASRNNSFRPHAGQFFPLPLRQYH